MVALNGIKSGQSGHKPAWEESARIIYSIYNPWTILSNLLRVIYIRIVCRGWTHFHFLWLNNCDPLSLSMSQSLWPTFTFYQKNCLQGMDAESYSLHTFEALLTQSMENLGEQFEHFSPFFWLFSVQIFLFIDPELATLL